MIAKLPTMEQVEAVRAMSRGARQLSALDCERLSVVCDLADAILAAPVRELTAEERATWGACDKCGAKHVDSCTGDAEYVPTAFMAGRGIGHARVHRARLVAAPRFVRLVPVEEG